MTVGTEEPRTVTTRRSLVERPWLIPIIMLGAFAILLAVMVWLTSQGITVPRPPEKPRLIEQYTIETSRGNINVTEIRSGTEFNRILQLSDGQSFIESGHLNSWGERQIDMIGNTKK